MPAMTVDELIAHFKENNVEGDDKVLMFKIRVKKKKSTWESQNPNYPYTESADV